MAFLPTLELGRIFDRATVARADAEARQA